MPLKISHSQNALSQKIGKINLGHIENSPGIAKTLKKREISKFLFLLNRWLFNLKIILLKVWSQISKTKL